MTLNSSRIADNDKIDISKSGANQSKIFMRQSIQTQHNKESVKFPIVTQSLKKGPRESSNKLSMRSNRITFIKSKYDETLACVHSDPINESETRL